MGTPHIPSDPHTLPEIRQVLKVKLSLSLLNSSVPNYTLTHEKIHAREAWGNWSYMYADIGNLGNPAASGQAAFVSVLP